MRDITIRKPKLSIYKPNIFYIYMYLVIFFIIFSSGAILDQKYFNFSQIIVLGLCFPIVFLSKNLNKKYVFLFTLLIPVYIVINFINYDVTITNYILFLVKFLFVFIFVRYCVQKEIDIFKILNNIIIVICVYSLFTHVFLDILRLLPYSMEEINEKPYKVFLGFHLHWQEVNWFSWRVARNNSIFWEPGVFQIYVSFALFYQLFIKEKANKLILLLLIISMFTTYSTTGFMLVLALFVLKYLQIKPKTKLGFIIKTYVVPILIVVAIILGLQIFNQKVNNGTVSYDLRQNDLNIGFDLFLEKPIFGWGYLNNTQFELITGTANNSNGLISMMFHQGILGLLFHCFPIFALMYKFSRNKGLMAAISFGIFYFVSAATEPLMYANFFNLFIALGLISIIESNQFYNWYKVKYTLKGVIVEVK